MDRCIAIAELHSSRCPVTLDQGRASGLWDDEGRPNVARIHGVVRRDNPSSTTYSPEWTRSLLGDVAPAAVMDALGRPILAKLIESFGSLRTERLQMILIGPRGEYLCDGEIAIGAERSISSSFRPMIERALARGAAAIVLVHNHPSGICKPSAADIAFTNRFAALCAPLDLCLADHLIIAGNSVFSMQRAGLL